jgi:hypothetical protein
VSTWQAIPVEQFWKPATFRNRGVAVPFTSPAVAGARARGGEQGIELVVPHPAGARGVYILAWPAMASAYNLTLHDTLLLEQIAGLPMLNPRVVRDAARIVASSGSAGRAAQDAAQTATAQERDRVLLATRRLMQKLLVQAEDPMAGPETHASGPIERIAASLGCSADTAIAAIAKLAFAYAWLGLEPQDSQAPCRLVLAALDRLSIELTALIETGGTAIHSAAACVLAASEATRLLARLSVEHAAARTADLPALLRTATCGLPGDEADQDDLMRAAWLLDGWEQICLVWRLAAEGGRQLEALAEMVLLVPALPEETKSWSGIVVKYDERQHLLRSWQGFDTWRTGSAVYDLVARNERIRSLAA